MISSELVANVVDDVDDDDVDNERGDLHVLFVRIRYFNKRNFPKSINGISFASISSLHLEHTLYTVFPL